MMEPIGTVAAAISGMEVVLPASVTRTLPWAGATVSVRPAIGVVALGNEPAAWVLPLGLEPVLCFPSVMMVPESPLPFSRPFALVLEV